MSTQQNNVSKKKDSIIIKVMEKTGWTHEEADRRITAAKENLGISYQGYFANGFYNMTEEEQKQKYAEMLAKQAETKERCIQAAMEYNGWSREEAEHEVEDARKRLNVFYKDYVSYHFYKLSADEQQERYEAILRKRHARIPSTDRESYEQKQEIIKKVMEVTGWSYDDALAKITDAHKRTGCTYKEFLVYKFYTLDESVQEELFLIETSRKIVTKYDNSKEVFLLLCDKELTNTNFDKYMRRPWCVNTKISLKDFVEKFRDSKRLIYKPRRGSRGNGVQAFDIDRKNAKDVFLALAALPEGIIEQYVVQHPVLNSLSPSSVNTIRIVTISSNTEPVTKDGKMMDVAYAALRIGGGTSIVDNFHSGGMVAAIDMETGALITNAADMDGNVFEYHPVTGTKIKGTVIPHFDAAVQMVKDACEEHHLDGYIGWDVAVTEDGPMLIEINLRPGVVLLTNPYLSEKKGMTRLMEKYL